MNGDHRGHATRHAPRHGQPLTAEEDRLILAAEPGTLRALAVQLGRTHGAIAHRRADLRRRDHNPRSHAR